MPYRLFALLAFVFIIFVICYKWLFFSFPHFSRFTFLSPSQPLISFFLTVHSYIASQPPGVSPWSTPASPPSLQTSRRPETHCSSTFFQKRRVLPDISLEYLLWHNRLKVPNPHVKSELSKQAGRKKSQDSIKESEMPTLPLLWIPQKKQATRPYYICKGPK